MMKTKVLAYYLPQFHEFEENNKWWGKGFTEWTCVKRTEPLDRHHIIKRPHPDIGYYCLEDVGVRSRQAEMAKKYGVYGFCYYHYWFHGKVLMQKTLEMMLEDNQPDIPFCLCWANEPWTRRMNGSNGELLQAAKYGGPDEWQQHFDYLAQFFHHPNYITVYNKPVLVIYRVSHIDRCQERFEFWRKAARQHGFDGVHVVMTVGNFHTEDYDPMLPHVDACVDFYPNWLGLKTPDLRVKRNVWHYNMDVAHERMLSSNNLHETHYKGMLVGFDSYPRSGIRSNVFVNNTPQKYGKALVQQLRRADSEFLFLNAWNEWGEGCCLEPDEHFNYQFLEETRAAMRSCIL